MQVDCLAHEPNSTHTGPLMVAYLHSLRRLYGMYLAQHLQRSKRVFCHLRYSMYIVALRKLTEPYHDFSRQQCARSTDTTVVQWYSYSRCRKFA